MEDNKKSVVENALAEFDLIKNSLNENTKEILRSVAKDEITSTLKESLQEDEYDIEDIEDVDSDVDALPVDDSTEDTPELDGELESGSEELGIDDAGMDTGEEELEIGLDSEEGSEDYGMDMTGASDEEVISVYKKMSGDDEIEVVSSNEVIIKDPVSGSEYNVKMGDSAIDQGEMNLDGELEAEVPELDVEPEMDMGVESEPEMGVEDTEVEAEPEMDAEDTEVEAEPEMDAEDTEEEEEDLGEAVVYEIELSEDDEIVEDIVRTKGHDKELTNTPAPNTGDIEGQKAKEDSDSGDNLEGGFDEDGQNGSGDAHAQHIMEDEDVNEGEEDVNEDSKVDAAAGGLENIVNTLKSLAKKIGPAAEKARKALQVIGDGDVEEQIAVGIGQKARQKGTGADSIGQPKPLGESKKLADVVSKYNTLLAEAKKYKNENDMFRTTLKDFRKTITETAVFNINLTHATKLFLEHSTTGEEKKNILTRFDEEVNTIEESKRLYKRLNSELSNKTQITESINNKIVSDKSSGISSKINESVTYMDPAQKRVIDLMKRTNS